MAAERNGLTLRRPTLRERLAYKLNGRWPESYVAARLAHLEQSEREARELGRYLARGRGEL